MQNVLSEQQRIKNLQIEFEKLSRRTRNRKPDFLIIKYNKMIFFQINIEDDKSDRDNHSNQLNSNNDAYYQARGLPNRPDDWQTRDE